MDQRKIVRKRRKYEATTGIAEPRHSGRRDNRRLLLLEQRTRWMISDRHPCLPNPMTVAGNKQLSVAEACYEIVRRAIAALGN